MGTNPMHRSGWGDDPDGNEEYWANSARGVDVEEIEEVAEETQKAVASFAKNKAGEKVALARKRLILDHPFFGSVAMGMELVEDENIPTFATDGKTIRYNAGYVADLTVGETITILAHECMHVVLGHQFRRGERDHAEFNIACDHAVNPHLKESGRFDWPEGGLYDPRFTGWSAEAIHEDLFGGGPEPETGPEPGGEGEGEGEGGDQDGPGDPDAPGDQDDPDAPGDQDDPDAPAGDPGNRKAEPPARWGDVEDAKDDDGKDLSPSDKAEAEAENRIKVIQSAQVARGMGDLPGCIERLVGEIVEPKKDWREVLRRLIDQASAQARSTWNRPNRRFVASGPYLPGTLREGVSHLVVAVDTSGSIDRRALDAFSAEISSIAGEVQAQRITVIYCDDSVQGEPIEYGPGEDFTLKATGGGGTDFRPPFERAEREGLQPTALVYFTDLFCSRYPPDPGYPVIWACWEPGHGYGDPPFGEVVYIQD